MALDRVVLSVEMDDLTFEWDPAKAESNLTKHGISFDEASKVFADAFAQVLPEPGRSPGRIVQS